MKLKTHFFYFKNNSVRPTVLLHTLGILHDQAEVGLLEADALQLNDVGVAQHPEELGFLKYILLDLGQIFLVITLHACLLDRHLFTPLPAGLDSH
jgi:hypothetical protein